MSNGHRNCVGIVMMIVSCLVFLESFHGPLSFRAELMAASLSEKPDYRSTFWRRVKFDSGELGPASWLAVYHAYPPVYGEIWDKNSVKYWEIPSYYSAPLEVGEEIADIWKNVTESYRDNITKSSAEKLVKCIDEVYSKWMIREAATKDDCSTAMKNWIDDTLGYPPDPNRMKVWRGGRQERSKKVIANWLRTEPKHVPGNRESPQR